MKAQDERPNRPGKAAPEVRRYLDELERIHLRAAKRAQGTEGLLSDYPVDALAAILDRAAARVADDADALGRVKFLQKGITIAREELKLYKGWYTTEWKPLGAARKMYIDFVRQFVMEDPVALHPGSLCLKGPFLRGTPRRTPEQRAYYEALHAKERAKKSKAARETETGAMGTDPTRVMGTDPTRIPEGNSPHEGPRGDRPH